MKNIAENHYHPCTSDAECGNELGVPTTRTELPTVDLAKRIFCKTRKKKKSYSGRGSKR